MLFVLLCSPALAAEPPTKERLEELQFLKEETVSIAVRHEQPISQAPSDVYVITDEDIRQSGATDLPTVLRRIPGIEVMQMNGGEFNVSAHGDNQLLANKMLVMVDGRSIYIDVLGIVFWKSIPITLPEIKRIEVLIGPASVLYGFNAFDGIIHIITKSPEEMKGTTLQFGGGEFGTISSAAIQAGTVGKFGYRLSVGHDQNQQWRNRGALSFRDDKFNINTEYALSADSKVLLSGGLVDPNRLEQIFDTQALVISPALSYAQAAYERPNFFVRVFWNGVDDFAAQRTNPLLGNLLRITDRTGSTTSPLLANTYNIDAQHGLELGSMNRFTYGVNYRHNSLSDSFLDHFRREDRLGFYVQDEWKATQAITVVGGIRYDLHTEIHATISPRLALLYSAAPGHTFRAGLSVAYRPPTILENYFDSRAIITLPPPIPSPPPIALTGSPNLHPEQIESYELGYQGWYLKHRLRVRADVFFNHLSQLMGPPIGSVAPGVAIVNGGEADIYGGEAGIDFLATRWLSGFANIAYQQIGQTLRGNSRRGAPPFKFNVGLRGEWDNGLSGEVALFHVGAATYPISSAFLAFAPFGVVPPDERVGSYNLLNIRAGYRFWHEKAEVAVSVFNALNDRHKEHPLGDTIGSRVMGWLTLRF
jgi:iron complex outermembrane receptor protein